MFACVDQVFVADRSPRMYRGVFMSEVTVRKQQRPNSLDLRSFRQPIGAKLSILHRISGAGLFLFLPFLLFLLDRSLGSAQSFESFREIMSGAFVKLILMGLSWAYMHHFCAGIRHLFLDINKGTDLEVSRKTARATFAISLVLTLLIWVKIW